jgi:two-component system, chemotaxis family, protein-glutamate methylesterase/glutaminase
MWSPWTWKCAACPVCSTIAEIRKLHAKLPIIMFSTLTERGASTTLDALALGASDYVTKPGNTGGLDDTVAKIKEELLPKVKGLCSRRLFDRTPAVVITKEEKVDSKIIAAARPDLRIDIVAIGTSTGGPNTLAELPPSIPKDFPVSIVIV